MEFIDRIEGLEALYGAASVGSQRKVAQHLTPSYRRWIEASRFCILSTVGEGGTDGSPRGDDGPVVTELDPGTLAVIKMETYGQGYGSKAMPGATPAPAPAPAPAAPAPAKP